MALHILANHQNVIGWRLVLNDMRTRPTHYYLDSSGQAAYMETQPRQVKESTDNLTYIKILTIFNKLDMCFSGTHIILRTHINCLAIDMWKLERLSLRYLTWHTKL